MADEEQARLAQDDYRRANLAPATRTLLDFAVKMATRPTELCRGDIATLRAAGFDDEAILDAVQTIGYFNYANRVIDALGIQPEPGMRFTPPE